MRTAYPMILTKAGHALLPRIVEGIRYARAGIMVTDLGPAGNQAPLGLFENLHEELHIGTLLKDVTRRYASGSVGQGHGGLRWFTRDSWWETRRSVPVGVGNVLDIAHLRVHVRQTSNSPLRTFELRSEPLTEHWLLESVPED